VIITDDWAQVSQILLGEKLPVPMRETIKGLVDGYLIVVPFDTATPEQKKCLKDAGG
jgi:hypothetical protein